MATEQELELMESVISRALAWTQKPASFELRQKVEWALRDLDSFKKRLAQRSRHRNPKVSTELIAIRRRTQ